MCSLLNEFVEVAEKLSRFERVIDSIWKENWFDPLAKIGSFSFFSGDI